MLLDTYFVYILNFKLQGRKSEYAFVGIYVTDSILNANLNAYM